MLISVNRVGNLAMMATRSTLINTRLYSFWRRDRIIGNEKEMMVMRIRRNVKKIDLSLVSVRSIYTGSKQKLKADNSEGKPVKKQDKDSVLKQDNNHAGKDVGTKVQKNNNDIDGDSNRSSSCKNNSEKPISEFVIPRGGRQIKSMIVPRVPSTDYIPSDSIHIEGLFAGYRPLFLGNSASPLDGSDNYYDMGNNLSTLDRKESKRLVVPWNVSVSGIKFHKDDNASTSSIGKDPFQNIPDKLLYKLRPFKLHSDDADLWINRDNTDDKEKKIFYGSDSSKDNSSEKVTLSGKRRRKNEMVVLKFHNPKINDRPEYVDLYNMREQSHYNKNINNISYPGYNSYNYNYTKHYGSPNQRNIEFRKQLKKTQKLYVNELQSLAYDFQFIRNDQIKFRDKIQSLNESLIDKFEDLTGLRIQFQSQENRLPIYIYFQSSLVTKRRLKTIISNSIILQTEPILSTLLPNFETASKANHYHLMFKKNVRKVTSSLLENIPSLLFVDSSQLIDCVYQKSPVPGFKRIYWLNPNNKRLALLNKRSGSTVLRRNKMGRIRSGVSEPITLYGKMINELFKEWDYYTK